jgi:hypothetical protein
MITTIYFKYIQIADSKFLNDYAKNVIKFLNQEIIPFYKVFGDFFQLLYRSIKK